MFQSCALSAYGMEKSQQMRMYGKWLGVWHVQSLKMLSSMWRGYRASGPEENPLKSEMRESKNCGLCPMVTISKLLNGRRQEGWRFYVRPFAAKPATNQKSLT